MADGTDTSLDAAILGMLRGVSQTWTVVDFTGLTQVEERAIALLTGAGMVERWIRLGVRLAGVDESIEAVITVTGEGGLEQALKAVLVDGWSLWGEAYKEQTDNPDGPPPSFVCTNSCQKMRLTEQGIQALQDVDAGDGGGVLDFVKKTGVFGPASAFCLTSPGEYIPGVGRPVVAGEGRIESIKVKRNEPREVHVTNLGEVSAPLCQMVDMMAKSMDNKHAADRGISAKREKSPRDVEPFTVCAGTTWLDVRLVVTDTSLRIEAKDKRKDYTFQEAGFEERRRKGVPDRLWRLLGMFGIHGGILPFKAMKEKDSINFKHYVSDLRRRLAALLPRIESDPIAYDRKERAYKTAFRISSEDALQFPTPSGASWVDVSIARQGDTGVRVSVAATERFATSGYADEDDDSTHEWVGAEREGAIERTYDLRMLGLADDGERPNRAGQALLAVIAGKGTVQRETDDKGMLDLCGVLTRLMGIEGSPFDFAEIKGKWVALFDATDGIVSR